MEELGRVTQDEALAAVMKYRRDEMLKLIEEAVALKREDESKEQLKLPIENDNKENVE